MRRADRLFEIVQHLRGRRLTTAAQLAEWLEVSERTVYRDIAALMETGVPIDGEAGVGYRIHPDFDLPPIMFSHTEIEALVMGARFVESWGGPGLAQGARSALAKIAAALPKDKRATLESSRLFAPGFGVDPALGERLESLRIAIRELRLAAIDYRDEVGRETQRRLRPLGLFFWGERWSVIGWCELRDDFRNFRLDRITKLETLVERFRNEPGRNLEDYFRRARVERD
jgi:predicted DNA-binding transcriptional regulator YafY